MISNLLSSPIFKTILLFHLRSLLRDLCVLILIVSFPVSKRKEFERIRWLLYQLWVLRYNKR